jgi:hypothetical protein
MKERLLACAVVAVTGLSFSATALGSWAVAGGGSGVTTGFPCVGQVGHRNTTTGGNDFDCSGTIVGNGMFVLTARHCLDGITDPQDAKFRVGDTTYSGFDIMRHPTADIAIIKLGVMLSDAYQLYCPTGSTTGTQFCGVGFGFSSNPGGTATSVWDGVYGTKRVFYNVIDGPDTGLRGEPTVKYSLTIPNGIAGEGLHGPGDSGGPMLYNDNGMLKVMGVLSYGNGTAATFQPRPGVSAGGPLVDEWTKTRVPAPGAVSLLAGMVLVLARRRRAA